MIEERREVENREMGKRGGKKRKDREGRGGRRIVPTKVEFVCVWVGGKG